jgi:hypothetical protein
MNREDPNASLIELGVASRETRGGAIGFVDSDRTLQPHPGLTDD